MLIDEILTPDSSRYFIEETYHSKFDNNQDPEQLSKEFVRQWLIENNFMGREGDVIPEMNEDKITEISEKYIQLIEKLLDKPFDRSKCQLISSEKIKTIIENSLL
jgi:phosphoribosylaminoimidazole-succinocarboxamide synthase